MTKRAIIIAAGMGSRLEHHTTERPKCMVEVGGKSILSHQLHAYRTNGVDDFHIIRGYLAERLTVDGATYYHNADFKNNNILLSFFCAEEAMNGPFLVSYSDIVFTGEVVEKLLASPHDISLVVDREWDKAYEGRHDHPVEQAELTEVDGEFVTAVGKQIGPENTVGEFIGLAKFTAKGAEMVKEAYAKARAAHGDDEPFQAAKLFRKSYMTDLFCQMIDDGASIGWTAIDGQWREIDTVEDLARVNEIWGQS